MHNQPRLSMSMPDPVHRRTSMRLKPRRHNPTLLNLSMPNKVDGRTNKRLEPRRHSPNLLNLSVGHWSRRKIHDYPIKEKQDKELPTTVGRKRNQTGTRKKKNKLYKTTPNLPLLNQEGRFEVKVRSANVVKVDWINMRKVGRQQYANNTQDG